MNEQIYVNGEVVSSDLPLRSLFYGEGVFETFRYKSKLPAYFHKHYSRMSQGATLIKIPIPDAVYVKELIDKASFNTDIEDAYVKVCLLSEGRSEFHKYSESSKALVIIREYKKPPDTVTVWVNSFNRNSSSPILRIKSLNYLENVLARRAAIDLGFDEALFLNDRQEITEGAASNIFWLKDEALFTPSPECGLLPGVTRSLLLDISAEIGLYVREGRYSLQDILGSECAFFTNSVIGAVRISKINESEMPIDNDAFTMLAVKLAQKLMWE